MTPAHLAVEMEDLPRLRELLGGGDVEEVGPTSVVECCSDNCWREIADILGNSAPLQVSILRRAKPVQVDLRGPAPVAGADRFIPLTA
ncbi:hypothetical protein [Kribbella sp. VKM Ac-2571]|uniref:hypothetical protein n=1 Tax=Kribbella sp. VKM Ac-2571 TaxID=2512222 RepID=UPI00192D29B5|nr:hypothetical protein [Kribbella sp. VKM Ac-2571]